MSEDFKNYLDRIKFEKHLNKLTKKLKNKRIIIYGSGSFFKYIKENYNLSRLNIIGISDLKFSFEQEGHEYLGYKIIPKQNILNYDVDVILISTLRYISITEDLEENLLKNNSKIQIYTIAKLPFWDLVKEIWGRAVV